MSKPDDLDVLQAAKPFVRSILAFILFIRFAQPGTNEKELVNASYDTADTFINKLENDIISNTKVG